MKNLLDWSKKYSAVWNVFSTIVLAITCVGIFYQAYLTNNILQQQKSVSYWENRAYIEINNMIIEKNEKSGVISFTYTLRNNGKTPAFSLSSAIGCSDVPIDDFSKGNVESGGKYLPPQALRVEFVDTHSQCEKFKIVVFYKDYSNVNHSQGIEFSVLTKNDKYIPDITDQYEQ